MDMRLRMPSARVDRTDPADLPTLGMPSPVTTSSPEPAHPVHDPDPSRQLVAWQVPWGVRTASEWSWRLLLIATGTLAALWLFAYLSEVTVPIVIGLLLAAC